MLMLMKRLFAIALSLILCASLFLTGCSASPIGMTGNYRQDTLALIDSLRTAITLPEDSPDKTAAQSDARGKINAFISNYRRSNRYASTSSFMTMTTALNSLAGHYSSYPNRPLPDKLKTRLEQEFKSVEVSLDREPA
jgi:photosystem II Psb27 protein